MARGHLVTGWHRFRRRRTGSLSESSSLLHPLPSPCSTWTHDCREVGGSASQRRPWRRWPACSPGAGLSQAPGGGSGAVGGAGVTGADGSLPQGLFSVLVLAWVFLPIYIAGQVSPRARSSGCPRVPLRRAHPRHSPLRGPSPGEGPQTGTVRSLVAGVPTGNRRQRYTWGLGRPKNWARGLLLL